MDSHPLFALCPLDGRYFEKTQNLRNTASEYGLIYFRTLVEIHWLRALSEQADIKEVPALNSEAQHFLQQIMHQFSLKEALQIKQIEKITNHDVKAVEYFLQQQFRSHHALKPLIPFIHFGCTSEDINNLAYALMVKTIKNQQITPKLQILIECLGHLAKQTANISMLSRTHGQAASPTTLGKEITNFIYRFEHAHRSFSTSPIQGKWNGAVGNFNAHVCAYPEVDWQAVSRRFVESLGLTWNSHTTQIEPHDYLAQLLHSLARINTICIDFSRDIWGYISLGYFRQKKQEQEVGSSTMPHKINPIDFENAEGNLGIANALAEYMAAKLPISRFQRDLTDSTVLRNLALVFGYSLIAYQALLKGLEKLEPDAQKMQQELASHWEVLAEAIQTVMRRCGMDDAYEKLKTLTRTHQTIDSKALHQFIETLAIPEAEKQKLYALTPLNYIGLAIELTH